MNLARCGCHGHGVLDVAVRTSGELVLIIDELGGMACPESSMGVVSTMSKANCKRGELEIEHEYHGNPD